MPDLSNVHFLERGLNWSTLAYVVFLCLAAATSFLLAIFAGRVTSAKNDELKRIQSTSAEAVANAHAGAARAQAQAALAYKEQEHAKVHREQLRRENLALQLAVEKERAARLQLEERLAGRHISLPQRQTVERALTAFRGQHVQIILHPGDPEINTFAGDIKAALEGSGLAVNMAPALVFGPPQPGIALEVGMNRRQFATALAKALVDAGVCSGPITATEADDPDVLEITVGPKPLGEDLRSNGRR